MIDFHFSDGYLNCKYIELVMGSSFLVPIIILILYVGPLQIMWLTYWYVIYRFKRFFTRTKTILEILLLYSCGLNFIPTKIYQESLFSSYTDNRMIELYFMSYKIHDPVRSVWMILAFAKII